VDELKPNPAEGGGGVAQPPIEPSNRASRRRLLLVAAALVLVIAAIVAIYIVLVGPSSATRLEFGTGGVECDLVERKTRFTVGEPIRIAVDFNPELVTGTEVAFRLLRDGTQVESYGGSLILAEPTPCIHTTLSGEPLPAGHYRFEVVVASDTVPPLSGEFDISD
jgi:hypothetical protein